MHSEVENNWGNLDFICQDLTEQFGKSYSDHFKQVLTGKHGIFKPSLGCPYCYGNPNWKSCAQCNGRGSVESLLFSHNMRFEGVKPLGE